MPPRTKIGQYRHTPSTQFLPGPDGKLQPTRVRRRFPLRGLVLMGYGTLGPLVCAGTSLLLRAGGARFLPPRASDQPLPPSPGLENVLFGAGLPEVALACALAGGMLWRGLWKMRLSPQDQARGVAGALPRLLPRALLYGPLWCLAALPLCTFGLCLRAQPADVPWFARPFTAFLGAFVLTGNYLVTGIIPLVTIALGLLLGLLTAVGVAYFWQQHPEEAVPG